MKLSSFRELRFWQAGISLVQSVYSSTKSSPREESWGLQTQIRQAAVSVPSNIAEGHNREHLGDYLRSLSIAQGSLAELETQVEIASCLGYLPEATRLNLLQSVTALASSHPLACKRLEIKRKDHIFELRFCQHLLLQEEYQTTETKRLTAITELRKCEKTERIRCH